MNSPAAQTNGQWLVEQRRARGWGAPLMRDILREAAAEAGDKLPANHVLSVMIRRWESDRSGVSERYRLHYCRAFRIPLASFGQVEPVTLERPGMMRRSYEPANRDAHCFLLGYVTAMRATAKSQNAHLEITSRVIRRLLADKARKGEAVATVQFSLNHTDYEIDLTSSRKLLLQATLLPYIEHARKVLPHSAESIP